MLNRNEDERVGKVRQLGLLEKARDEALERVTRLAARYFQVPHAAVTVISAEEQWMRAGSGLPVRMPRAESFCQHTIRSGEVLLVEDAREDPRFRDTPMVQREGLRFYAGAPLLTQDGYALGSLCVMDRAPRRLGAQDRHVLADLAALVVSHIEIQHAALRLNTLTQLPNRLQWDLDLASFSRQQRGWVILVDLLDLRDVTDLMRALSNADLTLLTRSVTDTVKACLDDRWPLYHVGVERVAVMLPKEDGTDPEALTQRILAALREPVSCAGVPIRLEPRAGIVPIEGSDVDRADLLRLAISAALEARADGRPYAWYDAEADARHRRSFELLTEVPAALRVPEAFRLVFQPRIDLRTGRVKGAEALLRWTHRQLGAISPAEFIPLVEKTTLVQPLTHWVLQAAVEVLGAWQRKGCDMGISVNVTAHNLQETDLADRIETLLGHSRVPADRLELEFTETMALHNSPAALAALEQLRRLGLRMAIDDYGTGYSNLAALHRLPATILKIDQSLIRDLPAMASSRAVVKATIEMAHQLGYRAVAEGVETAESLQMLRNWGCDEVQGYYLSRPLEAADLPGWHARWHARLRNEGWPWPASGDP